MCCYQFSSSPTIASMVACDIVVADCWRRLQLILIMPQILAGSGFDGSESRVVAVQQICGRFMD